MTVQQAHNLTLWVLCVFIAGIVVLTLLNIFFSRAGHKPVPNWVLFTVIGAAWVIDLVAWVIR